MPFPRRFPVVSLPAMLSILAAFCAFVVYRLTLAPGLTFIDAGELAAVACGLGIAHPTGYPLFTLIGHLFGALPLGGDPIFRLNLMAAVLCAAGVGVFARLALTFLADGRVKGREPWLVSAASAGAALLLAFSQTYWSQATSIEVYPLHCFFLSSVVLSFLLANKKQTLGAWLVFAFLFGLSFTNHMTTVLLIPGFCYYYFAEQGFGPDSWRRIAIMLLPFAAALSVYVYLPLRAAQHPPMNWGYAVTWERFFWHVSGKQFSVWMFSSVDVMIRQFRYFLGAIPVEFAVVGLLPIAVGVVSVWLRNRHLALFTILLVVGCIGYAINYDIHDIDSYFLLAYFTMALWAAEGFVVMGRFVVERMRLPRAVAVLLPVVFCAVLLVSNWSDRDEHAEYLVDDYTQNMFASLEPEALILSYQWDNWVAAACYKQLVEGVRTDVVVVDKELLRRSWYLTQLESRYPWLIERSRHEVTAYLAELDKFEHGHPYISSVIEGRYQAMILSFVARNIGERPVYVTEEVEGQYTPGYQRVPSGLALRLYADTAYHPPTMPSMEYRPYPQGGRLEQQGRRLYADAYVNRGDYIYTKRHGMEDAVQSYRKALEYLPAEPKILQRLDVLSRSVPR